MSCYPGTTCPWCDARTEEEFDRMMQDLEAGREWERSFWRAEQWPECLARNITWACSLRVAHANGWWDGTGYHRDEARLRPKVYAGPVERTPVWLGGGPQAASLGRAA